MRIFITGATGLVGQRLVVDRLARGDRVTVLTRRAEAATRLFAAEANPNVDVVEGTPAAPGPWQRRIDGCDVVVHLAGANIAARRWTAAYRRTIEDSRLDSTYQVARAVTAASRPPSLLISASAVGIYGDTAQRTVDESAAPGPGALSELAVRWEEQAAKARGPGRRVALLRLAPVLDPRGGMLGRLLPVFRLGLGGPWGPGGQRVPWIHWRDVISVIDFTIGTEAVDGPVNVAAPQLVTSGEFARALGRVVRRPAFVPAPTLALRIAVGPLAAHLAEDAAVAPARLLALGYRFLHPRLEAALRDVLDAAPGRSAPAAAAGDEPSPPAAVQLIAIGVDGTMLRSDGQLPVDVVNACRAAEQAGCTIVAASSRSPRGLAALAEALRVRGPMIACNGAVVWSTDEGRAQHHQPLETETAKEVVAAARAAHPDVLVAIESIDTWYTDRLGPALEDGPVLEPDQIGPLEQFLDRPITRIELAGDAEIIGAVTAALREQLWRARRVSMFTGATGIVHVMHPMVDKGIALQRIAARLGVGRGHVMAIGDAENDQGMIEWAGFGVAVANAGASVRALADVVVPSNDDLGVVHAIRKFVLPAD